MRSVNIRLTHPPLIRNDTPHHHCAASMREQDAPATLDAGSDPVGQVNVARTHGAAKIKPWGHRFEFGTSDKTKQALGGVGGFQFFPLSGETGQSG